MQATDALFTLFADSSVSVSWVIVFLILKQKAISRQVATVYKYIHTVSYKRTIELCKAISNVWNGISAVFVVSSDIRKGLICQIENPTLAYFGDLTGNVFGDKLSWRSKRIRLATVHSKRHFFALVSLWFRLWTDQSLIANLGYEMF